MSNFDWQTAVVSLLVAVAAGYLAWRGWRVLRRRAGGCGSCGSCPANGNAQDQAKPLVQLENLTKRR